MNIKIISDLRFLIGSFFSVVGVILLLASFFGPNDYSEVVGIKVNLVVGLFVLAFGLFMLILAYARCKNKDL